VFKFQVSDTENMKYIHEDHMLVYGKRTLYFYCKLLNTSFLLSLVVCVFPNLMENYYPNLSCGHKIGADVWFYFLLISVLNMAVFLI